MAPYAEAGDRALLFAHAVHVDKIDNNILITIDNASITSDLLKLQERPDPLTIESDILGTVYKNGDPVTGPVSIPKNAVFVVKGRP